MRWKRHICAVAALVLAPTVLLGADIGTPAAESWADGISSDGNRTADVFVSGTESESTQVGLDYFGPTVSADIDYQRFIHRLDHDLLDNFPGALGDPAPGNYIGRHDDDFAGQNYAMRIQKFEANFKGDPTDNIKWGLNVWGMRKHGEREALAFGHMCGAGPCHVRSNRQTIDWLTMEIEPVIQAKIGPVAVEFSRSTDSFVRYKMRQNNNPLYGFSDAVEEDGTFPQALSSSLPEHEDLIEFGGTWFPATSFMLSATVGVQKRHHSSPYADFDEDDYPVTLTAWYNATPRWSISGGLAFFSNWIDQDVTIGKAHDSSAYQEGATETRFDYGSRAEIVNIGTTYAATDRLTFSATAEFVRSTSRFADPSAANAGDPTDPFTNVSLTTLPGLSDVLVETTRLGVGVDYLLADDVGCFFHYDYYQWDEKAGNGETGRAHMLLTGVSARR
ncbi:MAG TPA: hypothetical protein VMY42_18600 [Thermoguttaceae bacterium]|nr:hypothetical protein [Thermoguttaceae bacterium]